jgi:galactose mutarotase-like enzyme
MPIAKYRNNGCRITDESTYKGMRVLFLENEILRIGVLLDKGADIFQFLHKPTDTDFLWRSPQGLINPNRFRPSITNPSGTFLDNFHGGWQEILPGGGPFEYHGASIGLHGEITQLGWDCDILNDTDAEIEVLLSVDCIRFPLRIERKMKLKIHDASLYLDEKVINNSPVEIDLMWGHHPSFGPPFLNKNCRIFLPPCKVKVHEPRFAPSGILEPGAEFDWPLYEKLSLDISDIPGKNGGYSELLYLSGFEESWYGVMDVEKEIGIGLAWDKEVFPCIWFWSVYGTFQDYPWWDRTYVVALEPWTSMPDSFKQVLKNNQQMKVKGGGQINTKLCAKVITGKNDIHASDLR